MNNKYQRTLWMGNIESWMTDSFLTAFLNSIHIFPKGITLKNSQNKRGCAFLEFASKEQAEFILKNFNGKNINNFIIKFNRVKTFDEKFSTQKITKFTVSKRQNNFNYFKPSQLFIGNIDKSIDFSEVKNYFYERYHSIISAKLITNQQTGRSKGFAFLEFTDYKEFRTAMKPKDPIIFGRQRLVFNSAKNKYDNDNSGEISKKNEVDNSNYLMQSKAYSNSADNFNEYESDDTAVSNALISKENDCNNSCSLNLNLNANKENKGSSSNFNKKENSEGFLGENKTPDVTKIYKEEDSEDLLTLQIKNALKKMEQEYYYNYKLRKNKNGYNNYNYCEYFFSYTSKIWENNDEILDN